MMLKFLVLFCAIQYTWQATPTILNTDIGFDNDDNWALAVLQSLEDVFDLQLVVVDSYNTVGKARNAAKQLDLSGWSHVPIAVGPSGIPHNDTLCLEPWAYNYELEDYPGDILWDSADAMAQMINSVPEEDLPVQMFVIGACPTIPVFLQRYPELAKKCKVSNMGGQLDDSWTEYNINGDIRAAQALYRADWYEPMLNAPWGPTSQVKLEGNRYLDFLQGCDSRECTTMMMTQYYFANQCNFGTWNIAFASKEPQFDSVAIYLAVNNGAPYGRMSLEYQVLHDWGQTQIVQEGEGGHLINTLMGWNDLDGYNQWLSDILTSKKNKK